MEPEGTMHEFCEGEENDAAEIRSAGPTEDWDRRT